MGWLTISTGNLKIITITVVKVRFKNLEPYPEIRYISTVIIYA